MSRTVIIALMVLVRSWAGVDGLFSKRGALPALSAIPGSTIHLIKLRSYSALNAEVLKVNAEVLKGEGQRTRNSACANRVSKDNNCRNVR